MCLILQGEKKPLNGLFGEPYFADIRTSGDVLLNNLPYLDALQTRKSFEIAEAK